MQQTATKRNGLAAVFALLIAVIVGGGVWLAVAAAYENIRFSRGSEQILTLVSILRDFAKGDRLASTPGQDDLLFLLARSQFMQGIDATSSPAKLANVWQKPLTARLVQPALQARLEMSVPPHICRRLVDFFNKDAEGLNLYRIEARDDPQIMWGMVYDREKGASRGMITPLIACGEGDPSFVALTFALR
jgi:hypothetical protein